MKKTIFTLLAILFINTILFSQVEKHVTWTFDANVLNDKEVELIFKAVIDEHWHLYSPFNPPGGSRALEIIYEDTKGFKLNGKIKETPKPEEVFDEVFEKVEIFFNKEATFKQKIIVTSETDFKISGTLEGQTCLENGMCVGFEDNFEFDIKGIKKEITPDEKTEDNKIDDNKTEDKDTVVTEIPDTTQTTVNTKVDLLEKTGKTPKLVYEKSYENEQTKEEKTSLLWFFFIALGFGLTALLTPCVFPMIPMTVSFFMHSDEDKRKGKIKALVYGISIIVIYTLPIAIIIAIANIFGNDSMSADFANFLSTHWLPNIFFFIIFMVFAASFLGMFEIVLPGWLVNKTDQQSSKGGLIGVFFMAFTLVLVSFSCTGPIVGGILVQSTQGGDILKPIIGMLGFSAGVAIPFTLFAFFPSVLHKLPKSGGWLNSVKVVLGFIEIALGLKFLSVADQTYHWGILDREVYIALWVVTFFMLGLYLLGKLKFAHDSELKFLKVPRLILSIITFAFVVYLIPGLFGAPLKALSGYLPPQSTHDFDLVSMIRGEESSTLCETPKHKEDLHLPHGLQGYFDIYQAVECSKEKNKPIFIDFTGHGCVNCREMEANVWSDPRVLKILKEDYIICALYVDDKNIEIPENQWFTSTYDNKVKKTLGKQNADIQIVNFNKNSQPYYVLLDYNGTVLAEPVAYDLDANNFVEFLEKGKTEFSKRNLSK